MRVRKDDIPAQIDVPGAVARQTGDFGTPDGGAPMAGEYLSVGAGLDISPLLHGLEDDDARRRTGATSSLVTSS